MKIDDEVYEAISMPIAFLICGLICAFVSQIKPLEMFPLIQIIILVFSLIFLFISIILLLKSIRFYIKLIKKEQ